MSNDPRAELEQLAQLLGYADTRAHVYAIRNRLIEATEGTCKKDLGKLTGARVAGKITPAQEDAFSDLLGNIYLQTILLHGADLSVFMRQRLGRFCDLAAEAWLGSAERQKSTALNDILTVFEETLSKHEECSSEPAEKPS